MKRGVLICAALVLVGCRGNEQRKTSLADQNERASYAVGVNFAKSLQRDSVAIDRDLLVQGFKDAFGDSSLRLLTDQEVQKAMTALQQDVMIKRSLATRITADKNLKEGEDFLVANKKNEGVVTLPSGLQYKVITEGHGKKPSLAQTVTVHYRGTLINGNEFDSSYKRGQPAMFGLKEVIPAWTEALQHMTVGSKWTIYAPARLAYGDRGWGNTIGPNATLIFDIELLAVK
jgi:FKBP-type peptidyl-prolyl cis-trans isomerase FklB